MNGETVKAFFNSIASTWDEKSVYNSEIISKILDEAEITEGKKVLDVACGTGFLFDDYFKRNVNVTGIDISDEMVKICRSKYPDTALICGDAEGYLFEDKYDAVVIHNSLPHFFRPYMLFENLSSCLKENGRLTISHDMSRQAVNDFHGAHASEVSTFLFKPQIIVDMLKGYIEVDKIIDDDTMFLISGIKK